MNLVIIKKIRIFMIYVCLDSPSASSKSRAPQNETTLHFQIFCSLLSLSLCDTPISKNTNKWPHSELWNSTFFLLFSRVLTVNFSLLAKMVAANERVVAVIMVGGPTKGNYISFIAQFCFTQCHFTIPHYSLISLPPVSLFSWDHTHWQNWFRNDVIYVWIFWL